MGRRENWFNYYMYPTSSNNELPRVCLSRALNERGKQKADQAIKRANKLAEAKRREAVNEAELRL